MLAGEALVEQRRSVRQCHMGGPRWGKVQIRVRTSHGTRRNLRADPLFLLVGQIKRQPQACMISRVPLLPPQPRTMNRRPGFLDHEVV